MQKICQIMPIFVKEKPGHYMKTGIGLERFAKDLLRTSVLAWTANKRLVLVNSSLQLLQAAMPVASLYLVRQLVEQLSQKDRADFNSVLYSIVAFGIVQFLQAMMGQYSAYLGTLQQQKISDHIAELVLAKAVKVPMAYYENPEYHDSLHQAQLQSHYRVPQLVANLNQLLLNAGSLVFLLIFFFAINWLYALLFLTLSIPLGVIRWYYSYQLYRLEKQFVPMEREANYFHQLLTGIPFAKEVRAFGFATTFIDNFRSIRTKVYDGKKQLNERLARYSLLILAGETGVMIWIFVTLARKTWLGAITVGVLVVYVQGFMRLQSAAKSFLTSFVQIFQQRLFLKDLFAFLDIPAEGELGTADFPVAGNGLSVQHISFKYPGTDKTVLQDVSLRCAPGEVIAIIGENGSGKSTLVKLLARLYDVQEGGVSMHGVPLQHIAEGSFRANSFFFFQDYEKYLLPVAHNIALAGGDPIPNPQMKKAAMLAGADAFINRLNNGYNTRLGRAFEKSEQLSGGQWQRLSLSRMFYKNAPFVVLDEPTSAVDALAEHELFANIKEFARDKIVVLVSHTLYNLKIADRIYVMQEGRVAEQGSFDELIAANGAFRKMFDNQSI